MTKIVLNIDGVPEHFNLPWRVVAEQQRLAGLGISLNWHDVREGTGRMIERLNAGEADVALLLTEGAVAGIANGARYRIVGVYVESPLQWGVHVAHSSPLTAAEDLQGGRFAISRFGSGSHLMAGVYASTRGWPEPATDFVVVNDIDGARRALAAGDADIFMWERFTTQPFVDNAEFRRIDVLPTPWPCFVACASVEALAERPTAVRLALHAALHTATELVASDDAITMFAERYDLRAEQVSAWLSRTRWSAGGQIDTNMLHTVGQALQQLGTIDAVPAAGDMLA